jgi:urea-proton symporter
MLLLGGSAVTHALTGMNIYAAAFLIPMGIILCEWPFAAQRSLE